jgi:hypothetical protein
VRKLRARLAESPHRGEPEEVARNLVDLGHHALDLAPRVVLAPGRDVHQRQPGPPDGEHGVLLDEVLDRVYELVQAPLRDPDHEQLRREDTLRVACLHPSPHHRGLRGEALRLVEAALHLRERR